jgi:hypothetical protein
MNRSRAGACVLVLLSLLTRLGLDRPRSIRAAKAG